MKTENKLNLGLIALTILSGLFLSQCQNKPTEEKTKAEPEVEASYTASSSDLCESDWFPHTNTPNPAEGKGSPFDTSSTTNLIFHQWSWQKFLWLTKPSGNNILLEDSLTQISNELIPITSVPMGATLELTDVGQAGSNGILFSNVDYNGEEDTVYYSIYGNDKLINFADSMKNVIIADPTKLSNDIAFPVRSLEVKASWVKVTAIPTGERSKYYQSLAYISTIGDTATMAMLGMHVVSVVENHPEFIWATFEHADMAPVYPWDSTQVGATTDAVVTSSENLLFFKKDADAGIADITWPLAAAPANIFSIYAHGIPQTNGGGIMAGLSQDSASNISNRDHITGLNSCVKENLASTDVWSNYFYDGSIWANMDELSSQEQVDTLKEVGYGIGSAASGSLARGALASANITMETYQQGGASSIHAMDPTTIFNCFTCHNTPASIKLGDSTYANQNSPLYFSHLFRSFLSVSTGVPIGEIEKLRIKEMSEGQSNAAE